MSIGEYGYLLGMNIILNSLVMAAGWIYYMIKKQKGIFDVLWPLGFAIVMLTSFVYANGDLLRKIILLVMVGIWATRMALYFWRRWKKLGEDPRLEALEAAFGSFFRWKFIIAFLAQGFIICFVAWPIMLIAANRAAHFSTLEYVGIVVWLVALLGESLADQQLLQFRLRPENHFKVCQEGFWHYCRHPNYFFEWLVWVGFTCMAFSAPYGITAIISPIIMWYLLTQLTGIKPTEQQSLKSKGDAYRIYMEKTSAFFPWFPKK